MAQARQTRSGKWELALSHPLLPKGRKYFTFDDELAADAYAHKWKTLVDAGLPPPPEMLGPAPAGTKVLLMTLIREWSATGRASETDETILSYLRKEVGMVPVAEVDYDWVERWVARLKLQQNLGPSTIRARVGALARALDPFYRKTLTGNPMRMLPRGYSQYTRRDSERALVLGKKVKVDVVRDRRLAPGEHEALTNVARNDRDFHVFFELIVRTGLRLKEAYTLTAVQIDCERRTIRVLQSKQWRGKIKYRDVPIRTELLEVLKPYLSGVKPERLAFPFWDGLEEHPRTSNRLSKRFARLFASAGIVGLHEHDLRHEATCQWYELRRDTLGADGHWVFREAEIDRIMGWAPGSTMSRRYASFRAEDLASRLPA